MNIVMALIGGILIGVSVAALVVAIVLEKTISFGDSKGEFNAFSKFPIRMISKSSSNGLY